METITKDVRCWVLLGTRGSNGSRNKELVNAGVFGEASNRLLMLEIFGKQRWPLSGAEPQPHQRIPRHVRTYTAGHVSQGEHWNAHLHP